MSSDFCSRDELVERGSIPLDIDNVHMLLQVEQEQIQKKTFTNWVNAQLAKRMPPCMVADLFNDFRDGSRLLDLLEVMSGQRISRERGRGMFQHRSNIEKALSFLKKKSIKLVNINIPDIIDGKPSIILGLIWTIILQYHIEELANSLSFSSRQSSMESLASLDSRSTLSSRSASSSPVPPRGSPLHNRFRVSAKKALLLWVREQCHKAGCTLNVKDFKASWRSGVVFLAILYALRPDLVDLSKARTRSNKQNLEEAFRIAERELRIPRLLDPDDVDVRDPDEKSIMTYVAQFLQYSRDLPVPEEEMQTQHLTLPKTPSPINLPVHYTPAISASPLRQATPDRKVKEVTCWLVQAYDELLEGWDSTEGESYSERYHVFHTFLVSFNEQRRPIMPLLTAMRRTPKLSEDQRALREAWDGLTEKLREYRVELDASLPAPLDTVARWLLKAEGALAEEQGDPQDHGRAADDAREKQELLKVCLEEMPRHLKTFQSFQNLDEYGNMMVPSDKMDELKRRFTSVRVSAKYHGIRLEYREHRHTVLDLLGQIKTKLRVWERPYISPEAVRLLLQEWHELVNSQELPSMLEATLHKLKQVSERYASKSALAADYQHVSEQVKQLEQDATAALKEVTTTKSTMGRVLAAWDSYSDCLSSLQAWLEQGSVPGHGREVTSESVAEWGSRQAHLNEMGNFLIETTDPQTRSSLADELRRVNMRWAEFVKRNTFDGLAEASADVDAQPQDVQTLIREATVLLKEPVEVMAGPLRTYRKRIQFIMRRIKELDLEALAPSPECPADQLNKLKLAVPEVTQTLMEAEQVCAELQHSVSGLDSRLAELLHWETEARELYQLLRAAERQQRGQDPRARVLISRGLQLEGQVVTEEQDLQVMVITSQKNSPIQYLRASAIQDRVRVAVAQSQEAVGMLSSLGARRDRSRSPPEGPPPPKVFIHAEESEHPVEAEPRPSTRPPETRSAPDQAHGTFVPKIVVQEYREEKVASPTSYTYAQAVMQTRTVSPPDGQTQGLSEISAQIQQQTREQGFMAEQQLLQRHTGIEQEPKQQQQQEVQVPTSAQPQQQQQPMKKEQQVEQQQHREMHQYQVQQQVITRIQVESETGQILEHHEQTSTQQTPFRKSPLSFQELQSRKSQAMKNRPWLQKPCSGEQKAPAAGSGPVDPQLKTSPKSPPEAHAKVTEQPQPQKNEQQKHTQQQREEEKHLEVQCLENQQQEKQKGARPKSKTATVTHPQTKVEKQSQVQTMDYSESVTTVQVQVQSTNVTHSTAGSQKSLQIMSQHQDQGVSKDQSKTPAPPQPHVPMKSQVQSQSLTGVPAGPRPSMQPEGPGHSPAVVQAQAWAQVRPSSPMQAPVQGQTQHPVPSHIQLRSHPQSWAPVRPPSPKPPMDGQSSPQSPVHPQSMTQTPIHPQSMAKSPVHPQSMPQSQIHPQSMPQSQIHPQTMTQSPVHPQSVPQSQIHPQSMPQSQIHPQSMTQSPVHPQSMAKSQIHPQSMTQSPAHPQSMVKSQIHPQSMIESPVHPQSVAQSPVHPQSMAQSQIHPQSMAQSQIHPQSIPQSQIHPRSMPQSQIHPQSMAQSPIHPQSMAQSPVHPQSMAPLQTHAQTMSQAHAHPQQKTQSQALSQSMAQSQIHTQSMIHPQNLPLSMTQAHTHPQSMAHVQFHSKSTVQAQTQAHSSVQRMGHSQPLTQYPSHSQLGHIAQGQIHSWTQVRSSSPVSTMHPQAAVPPSVYPQGYPQSPSPSQWIANQETQNRGTAQQRHSLPQSYPQQMGQTAQTEPHPTVIALPQWPQAATQLGPQMSLHGYSQMGPSYTQAQIHSQAQGQPWGQTPAQVRPQSSMQQQSHIRAYEMSNVQTQQGQIQQQAWGQAPSQIQPQPQPQHQRQSQQYSQFQHQHPAQHPTQPQQSQIPPQLQQPQVHPPQPQIRPPLQAQPLVRVKTHAQEPQFSPQLQQLNSQQKNQAQFTPQPTIQSPTQLKEKLPPQPKPLAPQTEVLSQTQSKTEPSLEPQVQHQPMVQSTVKAESMPLPKLQMQTTRHPEGQPSTQPKVQSPTQPKALPLPEPKTLSLPQSQPQAQVTPQSQSQPQTQSLLQLQPQAQSLLQPQPQAQVTPQTPPQTQSPLQPQAQGQAQVTPQSQSQPQTQSPQQPTSQAQSPPQARLQTQPLPQPAQPPLQPQTVLLSQVNVRPQSWAESPDSCSTPPALAQVPPQAYTEAYTKAQALARNGFEEAKHCLQEHIMEAINIFEDRRISAEQASIKEEALRTLDPELLEEFLRAAKGMEAFCTPQELTDMEFYTCSVRTQWEACVSEDGSLAQAGQHLQALRELCNTLSPEDAHRLAQTQLRECETRLAAIQRQFSGDQDAALPESRIPAAVSEDLTSQKEVPKPSEKPQVTAEVQQDGVKPLGSERKEAEKQPSTDDDLSKKDVLDRYENCKRTLQTQLAKNEQSISEIPSDSVSLKGLHTRLQEIQFLRQETESLWSDYTNQCSQLNGNGGLEQEKTELQEQWRSQQLNLQRRGSSLGAALRQIDSTENHMVDFTDRLDRYLRQPKDVTAFTLANSNILKDIKELDDNIQSELDQVSRLDRESSDLDPRDCFPLSREVESHRTSLDQLRQQVRKSEAAARALDRFLMSLRTVDEDISGVQNAPCSDAQVLQDCRSKLASIRQSIDSLKEKAPQLDVLLQGARLTVTRDGAPASCLDMVAVLLRRLEEADGGLASQQKAVHSQTQSKSLGLRKRTLLGELRKLQETIEAQGLKEPTVPAVQHRLRALSDLEAPLQTQQAELHDLRDLQEKQGGGEDLFEELEAQWKDTQRAFCESKKQSSVLLELLKKSQSCRGHLNSTLQRAEQVVSDQASYMGKENLQRSIAKVGDIKEELSGLGEQMEEMRTVCRQLQSQLKKFPECSETSFEAEADTLMDTWLDVTEKTDAYTDNLRVALELWEKQLMLGGEVDNWAGAKLALFAESHPFHNEQQVLDMKDEIQAHEENIEHFHRKSTEIQEMLQSQEAPLELQVMETQLRKRMQQVKELFTDCTDVFEELMAVKTHLAEKIEECQAAVENIQTSLSKVEASQPKVEAQIQDLCDDLDAQEDQAEAVLKEVGLVSSVASPQVVEALSVDCGRLREAISRTKDMIRLKREEKDQGLLKVIGDEKQSFERWFQDLQLSVNECFENPESRTNVETSVQRLSSFLKAKDAERRLEQLRDQLDRGDGQVPPQQLAEFNDWLKEQQGEVETFRNHCLNRQEQMEALLRDLSSLQKQHDSFRDWLQVKEKQSVQSQKVQTLLQDLRDESGRVCALSGALASVRRRGVRAETLLKDGDNLIQRYRNLEGRLQKQVDAQSALDGEVDQFQSQAETTRSWISELLQPLSSAGAVTPAEEMALRAQVVLSSRLEGDSKLSHLRTQSQTLCEQEDLEEARKRGIQESIRETEEQWRAALQTAEEVVDKARTQILMDNDWDAFRAQKDAVQSWIRDQDLNLQSPQGSSGEEKPQIAQAILRSRADGDSKLQELRKQGQKLCDHQSLDESRRMEVQETLRQMEEQWRKVLQEAQEALDQAENQAAAQRDLDAFRAQSEKLQSWIREQKQKLTSLSAQMPFDERMKVVQEILTSRPEGESKVLDLRRQIEGLEETRRAEVQQLLKDSEQQWTSTLQAARQAELRALCDDFDAQSKNAQSWIRERHQDLQALGIHAPPEERSLTAQTVLSSRPEGDCRVNNLRRRGQSVCDHLDSDQGRRVHVQKTVRDTEEQWRTVLQAANQTATAAGAELTQRTERRRSELREFDGRQQDAGRWLSDLQQRVDSLSSHSRAEDRRLSAQAVVSSKPEGESKLQDLRSRCQSLSSQDLDEQQKQEMEQKVRDAEEQWSRILQKAKGVLEEAEKQRALEVQLRDFRAQSENTRVWLQEKQQSLDAPDDGTDLERKISAAQTVLSLKPEGDSRLSELRRQSQSLSDRQDLEEALRKEVQQTVQDSEQRWRTVLQSAEDSLRDAELQYSLSRELEAFGVQAESTKTWVLDLKQQAEAKGSGCRGSRAQLEDRLKAAQVVLSSRSSGEAQLTALQRRAQTLSEQEHLDGDKKAEIQQKVGDMEQQWRTLQQMAEETQRRLQSIVDRLVSCEDQRGQTEARLSDLQKQTSVLPHVFPWPGLGERRQAVEQARTLLDQTTALAPVLSDVRSQAAELFEITQDQVWSGPSWAAKEESIPALLKELTEALAELEQGILTERRCTQLVEQHGAAQDWLREQVKGLGAAPADKQGLHNAVNTLKALLQTVDREHREMKELDSARDSLLSLCTAGGRDALTLEVGHLHDLCSTSEQEVRQRLAACEAQLGELDGQLARRAQGLKDRAAALKWELRSLDQALSYSEPQNNIAQLQQHWHSLQNCGKSLEDLGVKVQDLYQEVKAAPAAEELPAEIITVVESLRQQHDGLKSRLSEHQGTCSTNAARCLTECLHALQEWNQSKTPDSRSSLQVASAEGDKLHLSLQEALSHKQFLSECLMPALFEKLEREGSETLRAADARKASLIRSVKELDEKSKPKQPDVLQGNIEDKKTSVVAPPRKNKRSPEKKQQLKDVPMTEKPVDEEMSLSAYLQTEAKTLELTEAAVVKDPQCVQSFAVEEPPVESASSADEKSTPVPGRRKSRTTAPSAEPAQTTVEPEIVQTTTEQTKVKENRLSPPKRKSKGSKISAEQAAKDVVETPGSQAEPMVLDVSETSTTTTARLTKTGLEVSKESLSLCVEPKDLTQEPENDLPNSKTAQEEAVEQKSKFLPPRRKSKNGDLKVTDNGQPKTTDEPEGPVSSLNANDQNKSGVIEETKVVPTRRKSRNGSTTSETVTIVRPPDMDGQKSSTPNVVPGQPQRTVVEQENGETKRMLEARATKDVTETMKGCDRKQSVEKADAAVKGSELVRSRRKSKDECQKPKESPEAAVVDKGSLTPATRRSKGLKRTPEFPDTEPTQTMEELDKQKTSSTPEVATETTQTSAVEKGNLTPATRRSKGLKPAPEFPAPDLSQTKDEPETPKPSSSTKVSTETTETSSAEKGSLTPTARKSKSLKPELIQTQEEPDNQKTSSTPEVVTEMTKTAVVGKGRSKGQKLSVEPAASELNQTKKERETPKTSSSAQVITETTGTGVVDEGNLTPSTRRSKGPKPSVEPAASELKPTKEDPETPKTSSSSEKGNLTPTTRKLKGLKPEVTQTQDESDNQKTSATPEVITEMTKTVVVDEGNLTPSTRRSKGPKPSVGPAASELSQTKKEPETPKTSSSTKVIMETTETVVMDEGNLTPTTRRSKELKRAPEFPAPELSQTKDEPETPKTFSSTKVSTETTETSSAEKGSLTPTERKSKALKPEVTQTQEGPDNQKTSSTPEVVTEITKTVVVDEGNLTPSTRRSKGPERYVESAASELSQTKIEPEIPKISSSTKVIIETTETVVMDEGNLTPSTRRSKGLKLAPELTQTKEESDNQKTSSTPEAVTESTAAGKGNLLPTKRKSKGLKPTPELPAMNLTQTKEQLDNQQQSSAPEKVTEMMESTVEEQEELSPTKTPEAEGVVIEDTMVAGTRRKLRTVKMSTVPEKYLEHETSVDRKETEQEKVKFPAASGPDHAELSEENKAKLREPKDGSEKTQTLNETITMLQTKPPASKEPTDSPSLAEYIDNLWKSTDSVQKRYLVLDLPEVGFTQAYQVKSSQAERGSTRPHSAAAASEINPPEVSPTLRSETVQERPGKIREEPEKVSTHDAQDKDSAVKIEPEIRVLRLDIQTDSMDGAGTSFQSEPVPEEEAAVQMAAIEARDTRAEQGDSAKPSPASNTSSSDDTGAAVVEISFSEQDLTERRQNEAEIGLFKITAEGSSKDHTVIPKSLDESSSSLEKSHVGHEVRILQLDIPAGLEKGEKTSVSGTKEPLTEVQQKRKAEGGIMTDVPPEKASTEKAAIKVQEDPENVPQRDSALLTYSFSESLQPHVTEFIEINIYEQDAVKPSQAEAKAESNSAEAQLEKAGVETRKVQVQVVSTKRLENVTECDSVHRDGGTEYVEMSQTLSLLEPSRTTQQEKLKEVKDLCEEQTRMSAPEREEKPGKKGEISQMERTSRIQSEAVRGSKDVADVQPDRSAVKMEVQGSGSEPLSEPNDLLRTSKPTKEDQKVPALHQLATAATTTTAGGVMPQSVDAPQEAQKSSSQLVWGEVLEVLEGSTIGNLFTEIQLCSETGPGRQLIEGEPSEESPEDLVSSTCDLDNCLSRVGSKILSCKNHPAELSLAVVTRQLEEAQECRDTAEAQVSRLAELRSAEAENADALELLEDQWSTAVQDAAGVVQSKELQLQLVTDYCRQIQATKTTLKRLTAELDALRLSPESSSSKELERLCSLQRKMEEKRTVFGELLVIYSKLNPLLGRSERAHAQTQQKNLQEQFRALERSVETTSFHTEVCSRETSGLRSAISSLRERLDSVCRDLEAQSPDAQWNCKKAEELMEANAEVKAAQQIHLHLQQVSEQLLLSSHWEQETREIQQELQKVKDPLGHAEGLVCSLTQSSSNPIMEKMMAVMRDGLAWAKQTDAVIDCRRKRVALLPEDVHRQLRDLKKLQSEVLAKQGQLESLVEEASELLPQLDQAEEVPVVCSSLESLQELSKRTTEKLAKSVREVESGLQTREKLSAQIADLDSWVVAHLHREASRSPDEELRSPAELDRRLHQIQETLTEAEKQAAVCEALLMTSKDVSCELNISESCQLFNKLSNLQEDIQAIRASETTNKKELDQLTQTAESSKTSLASVEARLRQMLVELNKHRYPITRESLQALEPFKHMMLEHKSQVDLLQPWIPQEKTGELYSIIAELHGKMTTLQMKSRDHERYLSMRQCVEDLRENMEDQVHRTKEDGKDLEDKYKLCQSLLAQYPLIRYLSEETESKLHSISIDLFPSQLNAERRRLKQNDESFDVLEMKLRNNLVLIERNILKELDLDLETKAAKFFLWRTQQELRRVPLLQPTEAAVKHEYLRTASLKTAVESRMRALEVLEQKKGSRLQALMPFKNAVLSECDSRMENLSQARQSLRSYTSAVGRAAQFLRDIEASLLPPQGSSGPCPQRLEDTQRSLSSLLQDFQSHMEQLQSQSALHPSLCPEKVQQLQESVMSRLVVRMSTLQAKGQVRLEALNRCAENSIKFSKTQDDITVRAKSAESSLLQVNRQKISSLSDCTEQLGKLQALSEEVQSLQRCQDELKEWCPEQSCCGLREAAMTAAWRRVSRLRRCMQELMTRSDQRVAEWSDVTDRVEEASAVLEQVEAELPVSLGLNASTEELHDSLQSWEQYHDRLDCEHRALSALELRAARLLAVPAHLEQAPPTPLCQRLQAMQARYDSVKQRSAEGLDATRTELEAREKLREELHGVQVWMEAADGVLAEMEQSGGTQQLQEVHSQLCTQKALLQRIMETLKMKYSDMYSLVPMDIEGQMKEVKQSLHQVDAKVVEVVEKSGPVHKLEAKLSEIQAGLRSVQRRLEQRSPDVIQAKVTQRLVWDELDVWHSCLAALESDVQDLEKPQEALALTERLVEVQQLHSQLAKQAEQRTTIISKIRSWLQQHQEMINSSTSWMSEAQTWLAAPCSYTTAKCLSSHVQALQTVLDDSAQIRTTLQGFGSVLVEMSQVCDISTLQEQLAEADRRVAEVQESFRVPLSQLEHAAAEVEAIESEVRRMENDVVEIKALLSSPETFPSPRENSLKDIEQRIQSMRSTVAEIQRCKPGLCLPDKAEETLTVFTVVDQLQTLLLELEKKVPALFIQQPPTPVQDKTPSEPQLLKTEDVELGQIRIAHVEADVLKKQGAALLTVEQSSPEQRKSWTPESSQETVVVPEASTGQSSASQDVEVPSDTTGSSSSEALPKPRGTVRAQALSDSMVNKASVVKVSKSESGAEQKCVVS